MIQFIEQGNTIFREIVFQHPFFNHLNSADLYARHISSIDAYRQFYIQQIRTLNQNVKQKIIMCITSILPYLPYRLRQFDWKIVCFAHSNIEGNMCHTLEDYICLTPSWFHKSNSDQCYILVHELIHIFQKRFSNETNQWIFKFLGMTPQHKYVIHRERSNPDLNELGYGWNRNYLAMVYNSDTPNSLQDASYKLVSKNEIQPISRNEINTKINKNAFACMDQLEHPYEMMATYLARLILKLCPNIKEDSDFHLQIFYET